jgi:hypothetical protein
MAANRKQSKAVLQSPVDCKLSAWSPWSACSSSCGQAQRQRRRTVKRLPSIGGQSCPEASELVQKEYCDLPSCDDG